MPDGTSLRLYSSHICGEYAQLSKVNSTQPTPQKNIIINKKSPLTAIFTCFRLGLGITCEILAEGANCGYTPPGAVHDQSARRCAGIQQDVP